MKDFEQQKTDAPTEPASPIRKARGQTARGSRDAGHVASDLASHSGPDADALRSPELSHPANATPLADLLGQLQHSHGNTYVQRVVADMNEAKSGVGSQSTDQGLDAGTRSEMESAFGENFGDVRVHADDDAERLNTKLGARAVTRGRDIYFGTGEYNPGTREGKELLAHELTHVVQQSANPAGRKTDSVNQPGDKFEQEADRVASAVVRGERAPAVDRGAAPSFQLQPRPGGAAQVVPGAIDLNREPHGPLPAGATYSYDASAHELILQGPPQMSVSAVQNGQIVFDSARASMTVSRTRTIRIRFAGTPLTFSISGITFRFVH
jgi:hypothetical protein